jgi:hypothetical protein
LRFSQPGELLEDGSQPGSPQREKHLGYRPVDPVIGYDADERDQHSREYVSVVVFHA